MKVDAIMRLFSIICYLFIFLSGQVIALPFGLFLATVMFDGVEPMERVLLILADVSLISLVIVSVNSKTVWSLVIEIVAFVLLLLPFIRMFIDWPLKTFNYLLFTVPFGGFVILYAASLVKSIREYNLSQKDIE